MDADTSSAITAVATVVVAMATVGLVGVTLFLAIVGLKQIKEIKKDAEKQRTLEVCNRYDNCPILHQATRNLRAGWNSGELLTDPMKFRADAITLLNYLDSIAIGIVQGLYIEDMARDHAGAVLVKHVKEYFFGKLDPATMQIHSDNFEALLSLYEKWKDPSPPPQMHYSDK